MAARFPSRPSELARGVSGVFGAMVFLPLAILPCHCGCGTSETPFFQSFAASHGLVRAESMNL